MLQIQGTMPSTMYVFALALLVAAFGGTPLCAAEPLRVCADPNNLPFSNRAGEGFENALAQRLAEWSGRRGVDYVWWPQRRGFVRNTLNAGRCDLIMGVPAGYEPAWPTRPYYRSSYVFVYRTDADWDVHSIDDPRLAELSIGVPVVGDDYAITPGAAALVRRGLVDNVIGFSVYGDYSQPNPPARLIRAVAEGHVDLAIAWGPLAGYFATRQAVPLEVVQVTSGNPRERHSFVFDISMATRRGDEPLHDELERLLTGHRADVRSLLADFGVPLIEPSAEQVHVR